MVLSMRNGLVGLQYGGTGGMGKISSSLCLRNQGRLLRALQISTPQNQRYVDLPITDRQYRFTGPRPLPIDPPSLEHHLQIQYEMNICGELR